MCSCQLSLSKQLKLKPDVPPLSAQTYKSAKATASDAASRAAGTAQAGVGATKRAASDAASSAQDAATGATQATKETAAAASAKAQTAGQRASQVRRVRTACNC